MRLGKLSERDLMPLLGRMETADASVILGPRFGEDAGVVLVGDQGLVAAADPVTFASEEIGWYAVHINANDVASTGAAPRWFLSTVLLPEQAELDLAVRICNQMMEACNELEVTVLGGHTEVTPGLNRPIVCGTMLGTLDPADIVKSGAARVGDKVILTKGVCIEGTALLAIERATEARYILGEERWQVARRFLKDPGISVVKDARIARENARVHAMHDPTEGGLCMGMYELARSAGLGIEVYEEHIPVLPESADLCTRFAMDPLRTLASGALLVCVAPGEVDG
ncbi:MAG: hypothetical protein EOM20_13890, partial [Spartobacteria bacterium]|nr:hypothetical protein [Spartobacteria bacterium]